MTKKWTALLLAAVLAVGLSACDTSRAEAPGSNLESGVSAILINGKSVYLKGFGKHEDFDILGRGFNWAVAKRDFECMKWTDTNCFRTSHYPYAEEWYQMADEEGFLIIDEVPAVGMMRSTHNFAAAGTGQYTYFFETPHRSGAAEKSHSAGQRNDGARQEPPQHFCVEPVQ